MGKKKYDIFISYRRDGGASDAKHLQDILKARGYRVFFDTDSLRSGDFNRELLYVIENCKDFIIILSPNALDRCVNEGDWVRQELACALNAGVNVIPIFLRDFHFPDELPADISGVRMKNGIPLSIEFFDAMVEKLVSFLHSKPSKPILRWLLPAAAALIAVAAAIFFLWPGKSADPPGKEASPPAAEHTEVPPADETAVPEEPQIKADIGDIVYFGSYEQDNDTADGAEAVEWRVLAKAEGRILVISEYALDCKPYNTNDADVTWETCSLREWLNGAFLDAAFSAEEQGMILSVNVSADENPEHGTDPGESTQDKVFLLSLAEANEYFSSDDSRSCKPTAYAVAQGCFADPEDGSGRCWWWLRSPGYAQNYAAKINYDGTVYSSGFCVDYIYDAVRPALWIDLESFRTGK